MKLLAFGTLSLCLGLVSLAAPGSARADDYLPLELGNYWIYDGAVLGEHEETRVAEVVRIWGNDVYAILYENSTHNEGLVNYWTSTPEGDVDLWGCRWSDGYGLLYRPPLKKVDAPLFLGKHWSMEIDVYYIRPDSPDTTFAWHEVWGFEVSFEGDLVLPGGIFHVFGIEPAAPNPVRPPMYADRSPEGLVLTSRRNEGRRPTDWWSDGLGEVQYDTSDLYQLAAHGQLPSPVQPTSWGRVKALYRR